jgi:CubicO group peptidase (beta-lactamase class C family)
MSIELPKTSRAIDSGIAQGWHTGAQLCVMRDGQTIERAWGDVSADAIMLWQSAGKPVTAVALAMLMERGRLRWDDRVSAHIPEFDQHGKGAFTIRHLLTHTAGMRLFDAPYPKASWDQIIARLCAMRPEPNWPPGEKAGYHAMSSWFILGEIVGRVDGRRIDRFVREEIFEPLGMIDTWMSMPPEVQARYAGRLARMWKTDVSPPRDAGLDTPERLAAPSPGSSCRGPARDLARFYRMLLAGGETLLRPETVRELTSRQRVDLYDLSFKSAIDWGLGFIVNSEHHAPGKIPYGFGPRASRDTFGHGGNQNSVGFADPEHGLACGLIFNGLPGEPAHQRRLRETLEAVYLDLGL